MRLLAALTAYLLCCLPSLTAQQTFLTGETIQMPSLGGGAADHATVAINRFGDVVVANHADRGNVKLVEAMAIGSLGQDTFRTAPTILLGDPSLNLLGQDTCRKPDVVALDDESFLIVWPRNDLQQIGGARLEGARIIMRDGNGALLTSPLVETAAPGEGHVFDPNLTSGNAGVMPDLVALGPAHPSSALAVYVHESYWSEIGEKTFREYDLRCVVIDWSFPSQSANFLDGPHVLRNQIPMDEDTTNPFIGGMVLPDVVLDDLGNLVICHEESLLAPHFGLSGPSKQRVVLERYRGIDDAMAWSPMESWPVTLGTGTHRPRRPMLSSSRDDLEDSVSLTWGEQAITGLGNALGYKMLRLPSTSGDLTLRDAYWVADPLHEDGMPVVADNGFMRTCFAIRNYPNRRDLLVSVTLNNGLSSIHRVDTPITYNWRPAASLISTTTPGGQQRTYAAISFEGADVFDPNQYGIYFTYRFW